MSGINELIKINNKNIEHIDNLTSLNNNLIEENQKMKNLLKEYKDICHQVGNLRLDLITYQAENIREMIEDLEFEVEKIIE